jgi:hypothetical protein
MTSAKLGSKNRLIRVPWLIASITHNGMNQSELSQHKIALKFGIPPKLTSTIEQLQVGFAVKFIFIVSRLVDNVLTMFRHSNYRMSRETGVAWGGGNTRIRDNDRTEIIAVRPDVF